MKKAQRKCGNQLEHVVNCSRSWRVGAKILSDTDQDERLKDSVEFGFHCAVLGVDRVGRIRKPACPQAIIARVVLVSASEPMVNRDFLKSQNNAIRPQNFV
jgi:hypothetical protein